MTDILKNVRAALGGDVEKIVHFKIGKIRSHGSKCLQTSHAWLTQFKKHLLGLLGKCFVRQLTIGLFWDTFVGICRSGIRKSSYSGFSSSSPRRTSCSSGAVSFCAGDSDLLSRHRLFVSPSDSELFVLPSVRNRSRPKLKARRGEGPVGWQGWRRARNARRLWYDFF